MFLLWLQKNLNEHSAIYDSVSVLTAADSLAQALDGDEGGGGSSRYKCLVYETQV